MIRNKHMKLLSKLKSKKPFVKFLNERKNKMTTLFTLTAEALTLNKKHRGHPGCKVECINTGKIYNTIREASEAAKLNYWTMSAKMEGLGKVRDKLGNEYRRLQPMERRVDTALMCGNSIDIRDRKYYGKHMTTEKLEEPIIKQVMKPSLNDRVVGLAKECIYKKDYVKAIKLLEVLTVKGE